MSRKAIKLLKAKAAKIEAIRKGCWDFKEKNRLAASESALEYAVEILKDGLPEKRLDLYLVEGCYFGHSRNVVIWAENPEDALAVAKETHPRVHFEEPVQLMSNMDDLPDKGIIVLG